MPYRMGRRVSACAGVGAVIVSASLSACGVSPGNGEPPCLPPAYSVAPPSARAGDPVTVQAPDADCNPRYGKDARIQVTLTDAAGIKVINTTAPMTDAGAFTYTFVVPATAAAGPAAVEAVPYGVDWCDDTGRNNRAGGTGTTLERTSCAARTEPLTIVR